MGLAPGVTEGVDCECDVPFRGMAGKGSQKGDPRVSAKGKALAKQVLLEEPWCAYCGAPSTHADHIIPLAAGGPHERHNMQGTCAACNMSKGDRRAPKSRTIRTGEFFQAGDSNARGEVVEGTHGHLSEDSGHAPESKPNPVGPSVVVTHGAWSR